MLDLNGALEVDFELLSPRFALWFHSAYWGEAPAPPGCDENTRDGADSARLEPCALKDEGCQEPAL